MRALVDFVRDSWRDQRLEIGPFVLMTHARFCQAEWNALEIGRDVERASGRPPQPPRKVRPNHLRAV
jgi:hypothetical protein